MAHISLKSPRKQSLVVNIYEFIHLTDTIHVHVHVPCRGVYCHVKTLSVSHTVITT